MTADPKAIANALLKSSILPQVPNALRPPSIPMPPQRTAQLSLGPQLPDQYRDGSRMWSIIDNTGAQTGVLHKPSRPFSTWNVLIGPAGQGGQQFNFSTKAQALAYMGITE